MSNFELFIELLKEAIIHISMVIGIFTIEIIISCPIALIGKSKIKMDIKKDVYNICSNLLLIVSVIAAIGSILFTTNIYLNAFLFYLAAISVVVSNAIKNSGYIK